jgi:hypothetical protein
MTLILKILIILICTCAVLWVLDKGLKIIKHLYENIVQLKKQLDELENKIKK